MNARPTPRMTFAAMCEYLRASPARQLSILREQKFPKNFIVRGYANALQQAVNFAVDGVPLNPNASDLESHEQEIVQELLSNAWVNPATNAARPPTNQAPMMISGVEISVFPDLVLADSSGKKPVTGALKFYCTKSKELDPQVGRWMASFLYFYRLNITNDSTSHCDYCLIYDVRKNEYYEAGKSCKQLFQNIESACQFISAVWPTLQ